MENICLGQIELSVCDPGKAESTPFLLLTLACINLLDNVAWVIHSDPVVLNLDSDLSRATQSKHTLIIPAVILPHPPSLGCI